MHAVKPCDYNSGSGFRILYELFILIDRGNCGTKKQKRAASRSLPASTPDLNRGVATIYIFIFDFAIPIIFTEVTVIVSPSNVP